MPLSKTDPTSYPDGGIFAQLSLAISNGAPNYEQTFETEGQAIQFSQRFYMWRKAVDNTLSKTQAKLEDPAASASIEIYNQINEELTRWKAISEAAHQCKIQRPRGSRTITMTLSMDWTKATNPTAQEFIAAHRDKINL